MTNLVPQILLHVCCAPCSPHVIDVLQREFRVTAFFYNPNIHPQEEYARRLSEVDRCCKAYDIALISGEYDKERWFAAVRGMEEQREGAGRCEMCYRLRLEKTAQTAQRYSMGFFATTLTVSPHKKAMVINRIGREAGERCSMLFYEADFKKQDGFKKSCELSKRYNFHRQTYCGCIYSIRHEG